MPKLHFHRICFACFAIGILLSASGRLLAQVPVYHIFGVNPYQPRAAVPLPQFSPLQQTYGTPILNNSICNPCLSKQPVTLSDGHPKTVRVIPSNLNGVPGGIGNVVPKLAAESLSNSQSSKGNPPSAIASATENSSKLSRSPGLEPPLSFDPKIDATIALDSPGSESLRSPSDIGTNARTANGDSTPDMRSQLAESRALIASLKGELSVARGKARSAVERAYAAEKTARAAGKRIVTSAAELQLNSTKHLEEKQRASLQLKQSRSQIADLEKQLESMLKSIDRGESRVTQQEKELEQQLGLLVSEKNNLLRELQAQKEGLLKSRNELAEMEKINSKLRQAMKTYQKSIAQSQGKKLKVESKAEVEVGDGNLNGNPTNRLSKRKRLTAKEQIAVLRESFERQLERSNDKIEKKAAKEIDSFLDSGKSKNSKEVKEVIAEMELQQKANEKEIWSRFEERVDSIRKEAAARAKS